MADEEVVAELLSHVGPEFGTRHAVKALKEANGDIEEAVAWLLERGRSVLTTRSHHLFLFEFPAEDDDETSDGSGGDETHTTFPNRTEAERNVENDREEEEVKTRAAPRNLDSNVPAQQSAYVQDLRQGHPIRGFAIDSEQIVYRIFA